MLSTKDTNIKRFEFFLLIFISLQPVIDVFTTLSTKLASSAASFGVFIRLFVMLICLVYILLNYKDKRNKLTIIYLVILGIVLALNLYGDHSVKAHFHLSDEVKFLAKIAYAPIMLFTYVILFRSLSNKMNLLSVFSKYVLYAILIIDAVMIVSLATGTSGQSYAYMKIGFKGWFTAGNELGGILAITFPISIIYAITKTKTAKQFYYWIVVAATGFSLLMLGTKVGYGALLIGLIISIGMCFITWFMKKEKQNRKQYLTNGFISVILLFVLIVATPFTPIFSNTYAHFHLLGINLGGEQQNGTDKGQGTDIKDIKKAQVENLILSNRNLYLKIQNKEFKKAPMIQKAFGMGYGGNFKDTPKMIEMDFYDLFYSLGILGFIVYIIPFIYMLAMIVYHSIRNFAEYFTPTYVLLLASLLLGLGIAYSAGHVITAPAVSIYLCVIIAYLAIKKNPDSLKDS